MLHVLLQTQEQVSTFQPVCLKMLKRLRLHLFKRFLVVRCLNMVVLVLNFFLFKNRKNENFEKILMFQEFFRQKINNETSL